MNLTYRIILTLFFCAFSLVTLGQSSGINTTIMRFDSARKQLPIEKLYLQTDKPAYLRNDTIWFKAYLLDADYLVPSPRSGLLYIELDDSNNISVKRIMVPLSAGVSWGNIALDDNIPEGSYTLRAYTNWMRNFGDDYIFKKPLYIASAGDQTHLVTAQFKPINQAGKNNIRANILISKLDQQPARLRDMQLKVMDGRHTLLRSTASTGLDGKLDINFDLPANTSTKNLAIQAKDVTKGIADTASFTLPVLINRPQNTDLQFMPEGGALVAGIPSKIGFKAIGEDGKGTDVSGKIYNTTGEEMLAFRSLFKGIGSFELTPQAGESYTAALNLPDGSTKSYPLPVVKAWGTALRINDNKGTDTLQLHVNIAAAPATADSAATYYVIGQSRGVVCYAASLKFNGAQSNLPVPKNLFPTGIARFTLLNSANQPLNERICYIDHQDNLKISIASDKKTYAPHDSIALQIQVTDKAGKPARGSFSLAVTDDTQVKADSLVGNIVNNLLFTADLKGTVEQPGYYFQNSDPEHIQELDNLMLTQGWTGYDWKQITTTLTKPTYQPEPEFSVNGTVTNAFGKPVANTGIVLLSKKPVFVIDTLTDKNGRFTFRGFSPVDTAMFVIQAKNKHGKSFNIGISVYEFKPPVFTQAAERVMPWYVNSDTVLLNSLNTRVAQQQAELKLMGPHVLKGVTIKATKVVKGSKNLNGEGGADQVLDEKDMEKAGNMTLMDILRQKVKGFSDAGHVYEINFNLLHLIIDGVNVETFFVPTSSDVRMIKEERHYFLKSYMDYITAEDIVGIEGMYNFSKYLKYDTEFYFDETARKGPPDYAFLEITTRSGHGAFMQTTPGVFLYKPLAFTIPRQFYRPRYTVGTKPILPDLRATIHWEPNIITDEVGKATVSFYSADKPGGYTIILEGTDLNGVLGYARKKLVVK